MKTYELVCVWKMFAKVKIEAESREEAVEYLQSAEFGLPDGDYEDDSFEVLEDDEEE